MESSVAWIALFAPLPNVIHTGESTGGEQETLHLNQAGILFHYIMVISAIAYPAGRALQFDCWWGDIEASRHDLRQSGF